MKTINIKFKLIKLISYLLTSLAFLNANAASYTYDNLNRLSSVVYDNGDQIDYQYDAAGNILSVTPILNDSDNDGMPDNWEIANGLIHTINDAGLDKDNDGYTNLQEYLGGSDPQDLYSLPVISGYTIALTASTGGRIQYNDSDGNISFTITSDSDHDINFVTGCGGTLSNMTYSIVTITADCTINVDFTFKYINTGFGHTCFKDNAGQIKCWGR